MEGLWSLLYVWISVSKQEVGLISLYVEDEFDDSSFPTTVQPLNSGKNVKLYLVLFNGTKGQNVTE